MRFVVNCRESNLRTFCREIHQCAKIGGRGGGVKPILAMPGFSRLLLQPPLPYHHLIPHTPLTPWLCTLWHLSPHKYFKMAAFMTTWSLIPHWHPDFALFDWRPSLPQMPPTSNYFAPPPPLPPPLPNCFSKHILQLKTNYAILYDERGWKSALPPDSNWFSERIKAGQSDEWYPTVSQPLTALIMEKMPKMWKGLKI